MEKATRTAVDVTAPTAYRNVSFPLIFVNIVHDVVSSSRVKLVSTVFPCLGKTQPVPEYQGYGLINPVFINAYGVAEYPDGVFNFGFAD